MRLIARALDNLMNNALRYSHTTCSQATLIVEGDAPSIEVDARDRVFDEPFVRLSPAGTRRLWARYRTF